LKKVKVLFFQTAEPTPFDEGGGRPMRIINILNSFPDEYTYVSVLTSNFFHQKKVHRKFNEEVKRFGVYADVHFINSPGYLNHISINRMYDHFILAINVILKLRYFNSEKPNVIIIGYPPMLTALVLCLYSLIFRIPYVLDIKDQWPDIFNRNKSYNPFLKCYIAIFHYIFKFILYRASAVITISQGFKEWLIKKYYIRSDIIEIVYLTKPRENLPAKVHKHNFSNGEIRLIFVGTINSIFDFTFLDVAKDYPNVIFEIYGDGPNLEYIKLRYGHFDNIILYGYVSNSFINSRIVVADGIIAPYKDLFDFNASIPNKIFDAIVYELPILTSLNGDVKTIIERYQIGETYFHNFNNFKYKLELFIINIINGHYKQGLNRIAQEPIFDHEYNYKKFKGIVFNLANEQI